MVTKNSIIIIKIVSLKIALYAISYVRFHEVKADSRFVQVRYLGIKDMGYFYCSVLCEHALSISLKRKMLQRF